MTRPVLHIPPLVILAVAVLLALVLSGGAVLLATGGPYLDLPPGAVALRVGNIGLTATDLMEEPDQLGRFDAMQAFFDRQSLITAELARPQVDIAWVLPDGTRGAAVLAPRPRGLSDLPVLFWFQQGVGILALLVGGWVLSFRRHDWGAAMFGLTSLFVPVFALAASVYSTRQIALEGDLFATLSAINHFGAVGFGAALVGLFLMYPRPLLRARWLVPIFGVYGALYLADTLRLGEATIVPLIVMSQMLGAIVVAAVQWWRSRNEPLDRAGLRWFFLTSLVGCSLFIGLSVMPPALGLSESGFLAQGYAFGFFNFMHVGLALGLTRWRLFDLDRYAYYIWLWLAGAVLIVMLDLALLEVLRQQPWASLSVALLIAGFVYFPIRQFLLRRLFATRGASIEGRVAEVLTVALAPTAQQHNQRWNALLEGVYAPASPPAPLAQDLAAPQIADSGLALDIPGIDGLQPRRLRYASGGRRLFNSGDVETARTLIQLHTLVGQSRDAYDQGVDVERARISRDVHDNIGAQLLSALHTPEGPRKDDLLRDTLTDLRNIINDGFRARFSLSEIAADLRIELADRLELQEIELDWTGPDGAARRTLDFRQANALRSILREAVSNTIKHARAGRLCVTLDLEGDRLTLDVQDDGCGFDDATALRGNGLANIAERARMLGGEARIDGQGGGTRLRVALPLDPVPAPSVVPAAMRPA